MPIKEFLKSVVNYPLGLANLRIGRRRTSPQYLYDACLQEAFAGVQSPFVLDVGAHHGETVAYIRERFPDARIVAFEPTPESFQLLTKLQQRYKFEPFNLALGAKNGQVDFHVNSHSPTNSILAMDAGASRLDPLAAETPLLVRVALARLDDFLVQHQMQQSIDYLKLDVQGYEVEVIKGATETLRRVRFVMTEVQFNPVYQNSSKVDELCYEFYSRGFRLVRSLGYLPGHDVDQLVSSDFFFKRV